MEQTSQERINVLDRALSKRFDTFYGASEEWVMLTDNLKLSIYAEECPSDVVGNEFYATIGLKNTENENLKFLAFAATPKKAIERVLRDFHDSLGVVVIDINDLLKRED